jgi:hypothetical protein
MGGEKLSDSYGDILALEYYAYKSDAPSSTSVYGILDGSDCQ